MVPFHLEQWLAEAESPTPIVQAGAAVLRRPAAPVPSALLGSAALKNLVARMVATMRAAPGVGLAAPQIGVPLRIFVAEDTEDGMARLPPEGRAARGRVPLPLAVFVNPRVSVVSTEQATFYEGCLSVVGYGALVPRASVVDVEALDANGRPFSMRLSGWPARIMQHEADHLDGTLYVDRMVTRSFAAQNELGRLAAMPVGDVVDELVRPQ